MLLQKLNIFLGICLSFSFVSAFASSYMRVQTTLIGYELGELKNEEQNLLEERSRLKMKLAELSSKEQLLVLSSKKKTNEKAKQNLAAH